VLVLSRDFRNTIEVAQDIFFLRVVAQEFRNAGGSLSFIIDCFRCTLSIVSAHRVMFIELLIPNSVLFAWVVEVEIQSISIAVCSPA